MAKINLVFKTFLSAFIIAFLLFKPAIIGAQTTKQKIAFSSINQVGLLTGSAGEAVSVQTINGIKKSRSFAGVGVGLDFYGLKTVPLFVDLRTDFSLNKNTPFAYFDAGVNFLSLNHIQKEQAGFPSTSPGVFYDIGLGWKLSGKNNEAMIVSAGYTLKQARYKTQSYSIFPAPQMQSENYDRYNFLYRRLVIKIGFQL
jgi:hypothetical protein